jgi:acetyl-CoA C-acetyltransferase
VERDKEFKKNPVWLIGLGCGTDTLATAGRKDLTTLAGTVEAARQAYEMAGVGPDDIDVATVHDCFTIAEICAYEDLGFCKKGEGGKFIEEKQSYLGGKIPINIDGGLKAKGHPVGATGCSMAVEIVRQLKGECGERQVKDAKIGLTHNVGGNGQVVAVHIYRRE